jgi:hypothetical protein
VIPNVAHFVWFGDALPWIHAVAVRSAARAGEFTRVVLHHDSALRAQDLSELRRLRRFETRRIEVRGLFRTSGVDPTALLDLYNRVREPGARTSIVRAAILAAEGGVYLDMDTVTVASFAALRQADVFCGTQRVAFASDWLGSGSLRGAARAYAMAALQNLLGRLPQAARSQRALDRLYATVPYDAVLAARANQPFMLALLDGMLRLPRELQLRRAALGTHVLQATVANFRGAGLVVHPPAVFYPLGPAAGEPWFRMRRHAELSSVLSPETRLVHWYASLRARKLLPRIDAAYVRRHAKHQLLSALLAPYAATEDAG